MTDAVSQEIVPFQLKVIETFIQFKEQEIVERFSPKIADLVSGLWNSPATAIPFASGLFAIMDAFCVKGFTKELGERFSPLTVFSCFWNPMMSQAMSAMSNLTR
jgi:hypothetical protein